MPNVTVSVVHYLNTAPLIWGMLHGGQQGKFELTFTSPARCADAVMSGQANIGIIPSIELQRIANLEVIPDISISSLDRVGSVALFSKRPIEQVESVALDNSSRTSIALLKVLLEKFYGLRPHVMFSEPNGDAMLAAADAALLIGDPALAYRRNDLTVYDLGAEWKKFTGLPFVYAVWAGPKSSKLSGLAADFQASRDYGLERLEDVAAEYGPRHGFAPAAALIYFTQNIDYNLTEEHCKGMALFHKLACEIGLVPAVQDMRFAT